ncbi:hypothetical protein NNO_1338 [Hydrogenimonas sp.]|nr:hypothetical protein NNO_1338 [Hydrogenimonas sp.]
MKKTLSLFIVSILAVSTAAAVDIGKSDLASKTRLKNTMRKFATGLDQIQKGIIYNEKDRIEMGVRVMRQAKKNFLKRHGEILKKQMPDDPKFAYFLAQKSAERIQKYVKMMSSEIRNTHDFSKIAAAYTAIFNQCVGCHQKLRKNYTGK